MKGVPLTGNWRPMTSAAATEVVLPQPVADYGHRAVHAAPVPVVRKGEDAAEQRLHPERLEEFAAGQSPSTNRLSPNVPISNAMRLDANAPANTPSERPSISCQTR